MHRTLINVAAMKRKDFLTRVGLAGAGFSIIPRHVLGGKGFTAPSDTLYIGAIGAGGRGNENLRQLALHPNVKVYHFCDVDERMVSRAKEAYPNAPFYKDYRKMLDSHESEIDAIVVSTPDHNHAVQTMAAIQRGMHVYVEKPLTHDIYEARMLTEAARKHKVVTQMGNYGSSGDGVRQMKEWLQAGIIGQAHTVYVWTNRPVWPQGISWPTSPAPVPEGLDWDLWLGTAPYKEYVEGLAPFNWRGWSDYGTGALGDMGCHLMETPFNVLDLGYPDRVECSVGAVYVDEFRRGEFPDGFPPSSHVVLRFPYQNGDFIKLHWMDGGIQPARPEELEPDELMGDGGNGVIIIGDRGKMMCDTYGRNARLLPTRLNEHVQVPQTLPRVPEGHHHQWVNACLAGYGEHELSSSFDIAGPLTESVLMGNLAIRSYDYKEEYKETYTEEGLEMERIRTRYPGRGIQLLWDGPTMKVTNFEPANAFVRRKYREGWGSGVL